MLGWWLTFTQIRLSLIRTNTLLGALKHRPQFPPDEGPYAQYVYIYDSNGKYKDAVIYYPEKIDRKNNFNFIGLDSLSNLYFYDEEENSLNKFKIKHEISSIFKTDFTVKNNTNTLKEKYFSSSGHLSEQTYTSTDSSVKTQNFLKVNLDDYSSFSISRDIRYFYNNTNKTKHKDGIPKDLDMSYGFSDFFGRESSISYSHEIKKVGTQPGVGVIYDKRTQNLSYRIDKRAEDGTRNLIFDSSYSKSIRENGYRNASFNVDLEYNYSLTF